VAEALGGLPYSLRGGFLQPLDGAIEIFWQLVAVQVAGAEFVLGLGVAALGRRLVPTNGLGL